MTSQKSTLTVLIADGDLTHLQHLRSLVEELKPDWSVVCVARDVPEVMRGIDECVPQLLVLNMQLSDKGDTGWLHRLPSELGLVLVADDRNSAVDAFDFDAIDVLVKSYTKRRALKAFERAEWRVVRHTTDESTGSGAWQHGFPESETNLGWIKMSRGSDLILVEPSDVIYIVADTKYTRLVTSKGEGLVRVGLATMIDRLDAKNFVRVNRSAAVNLSYVSSIRKNDLGQMDVLLRERSEKLRVSKVAGNVFRCGI